MTVDRLHTLGPLRLGAIELTIVQRVVIVLDWWEGTLVATARQEPVRVTARTPSGVRNLFEAGHDQPDAGPDA
ncbi:MAG: hypothetical protein HOP14_04180 [Acidobacteria bacterium]|nr:hypothetical protein [Acidobacteriota bacterium]